MSALRNYFSTVAKVYPKQFGPTWNAIATETPVEMDELRRQLYSARFQYWFRKIDGMGSTYQTAKVQWCDVRKALQNPGEISYKQAGTAFVWGVQIAGCFALGEMWGRGSVGGYRFGDWWGNQESH